jgi:hypothetical protein
LSGGQASYTAFAVALEGEKSPAESIVVDHVICGREKGSGERSEMGTQRTGGVGRRGGTPMAAMDAKKLFLGWMSYLLLRWCRSLRRGDASKVCYERWVYATFWSRQAPRSVINVFCTKLHTSGL